MVGTTVFFGVSFLLVSRITIAIEFSAEPIGIPSSDQYEVHIGIDPPIDRSLVRLEKRTKTGQYRHVELHEMNHTTYRDGQVAAGIHYFYRLQQLAKTGVVLKEKIESVKIPTDIVVRNAVELNKDSVWIAPRIHFHQGSHILLQGFQFRLVTLSLDSKNTLIHSTIGDSLDGVSGKELGESGTSAKDQQSVSLFSLRAKGRLSLKLEGGRGGDGARGKNGANGHPGLPGQKGWQSTHPGTGHTVCRRQPTSGSAGGRGFPGSPGGDAGNGGNVKKSAVRVPFAKDFSFFPSVTGGTAGTPGSGGKGGTGGIGGAPGWSPKACRPASRGPQGLSGKSGPSGKRGKAGTAQALCLWVGNTLRKDCREFY